MGLGGQRHAPGRFTRCIGGWMGPRVCLDGCGKSRPPLGIRSPYRPTHSESLNRMRYPGLAHIKGSRNVARLHSFLNSALPPVYFPKKWPPSVVEQVAVWVPDPVQSTERRQLLVSEPQSLEKIIWDIRGSKNLNVGSVTNIGLL
jgi:hypothetical protein